MSTAIVFVHGFKGAFLKDQAGRLRWATLRNYLPGGPSLMVDRPDAGLVAQHALQASGNLDRVSVIPGVAPVNIYGKFLDLFQELAGAQARLIAFDYDWRLDNIASVRKLDAKLRELRAGGAARAAVAAFTHYGCRVTVYNRTLDKAEALADQFDATAKPMHQLGETSYDILINCTPLGMFPQTDATPLPEDKQSILGPGVVVFDTIYNPLETVLLRDAKAAGCLTINGAEMFVRQGAAQFELWTQQTPPLDVFRRVLLEKLASSE